MIGLAGAAGATWEESLEPGKVFQDCPDCPEVVVIPSGEFMMGSPDSEPERAHAEGPVHRVKIPVVFAVGKYEVTFNEWDACVSAGGCSHKPKDDGWGRGRLPVINVSWDHIQEYVSWLSKKAGKTYRLLSEAEWEYVARAGTSTPFHLGETGEQISTFEGNFNGAYDQKVPVGDFGANQFGLHDVHGNAKEWVEDCWNKDYSGAPSDGSAWTTWLPYIDIWFWTTGDCSRHVLRGSFWNDGPRDLRSSVRDGGRAGTWYFNVGFRVARTLPR